MSEHDRWAKLLAEEEEIYRQEQLHPELLERYIKDDEATIRRRQQAEADRARAEAQLLEDLNNSKPSGSALQDFQVTGTGVISTVPGIPQVPIGVPIAINGTHQDHTGFTGSFDFTELLNRDFEIPDAEGGPIEGGFIYPGTGMSIVQA